jgi:hypothetical protein
MKKRAASQEAGLVYVLMTMLLVLIIGVGGLSFDVGRIRLTQVELQNLVDTTATSGNSYLNGTVDGWLGAKRAMVASVRASPVLGLTDTDKEGIVVVDGFQDPLETETNLKGTIGTVQGLNVSIERGLLVGDDFFSLEGGPDLVEKSLGDEAYLAYKSTPNFLIANAVRVEVSYETTNQLVNILGASKKNNIGAVAVSRSRVTEDRCIFPAAVPACALASGEAQTLKDWSNIDGSASCGKEVLFTESQLWSNSILNNARAQGVNRYESFIPATVNELGGAQRVIYGVLGSASNAPNPVGPEQAFFDAAAVLSKGTCMNIRIGDRFLPIEDGTTTKTGLFNSDKDVKTLSSNLAKFINSASTNFTDTFGSPSIVNQSTGSQSEARPSVEPEYPFLAYDYKDRRLFWNDAGSGYIGQALMGQQDNKGDYTNPLCHYYGSKNDTKNLSNTSIDGSIPVNSEKAPVRDVYVMVVVPGKEGVDYCGSEDLGGANPITGDSMPIVIGFVKSYVYDFNFSHYPDSESFTLNSGP